MYNFLRDARTIRNSYLCVFDTLNGFSTNFHINGNVDGWDVYNSIYLYGCWNGTLFGSSYDRECYIGRTNSFVPIPAENFYYVRIMMKITNRNPGKVVGGLTTGKIRWTTLADGVWNSTKEMSFDIVADDEWHLYNINMGPAQWWQGDINNIRVYPFIDGWPNDQFSIKFIRISSLDTYKCSNTQCDYYTNYSHPCPGAGRRGSCEAGVSSQRYTVVSGVNDELIVNIADYGDVAFNLGTCSGADGPTMSRYIAEKIGSLAVGGYAYAECEYTEFDKLKIMSGVVGADSAVTVSGTAAEALGFIQSGVDVSVKIAGAAPASGYDYASSRILTAVEINKMANGYTDDLAYIHNPAQYNIEGGRADYNEVGNGQLISTVVGSEYYESISNSGRTLIDISHPINANGRIKKLHLYGSLYGVSKFKILRPHLDGTLTVVHSLTLPTISASYVYTSRPIAYRVDCDVLVNRGDLIGIYNADVYVGISLSGFPDASFFQVNGDVSGTFDPGKPYAFGVAGFAIYARGERYQTNVRLDIDLGDRVNIEQVNIYGKEEADYFEFNVASCLDLTWNVNLYGENHYHSGVNWLNGDPFTHTHTNIYYGKDCLDDGIKTADNGQVGTSYGKDGNGLWTAGSNHSYFYVNGDAEWLYTDVNDGKHEYAWPYVPGSAWGPTVTAGVGGFTYDPIAFTLVFPYNRSLPIHKSIIYFKETDNFRQMSLSYYLGANTPLGNADDPYYQYVPSYTMIKLDGIPNYPDEEDSVSRDYIFANPMDCRIVYASGDHDPVNWEVFGAAMATDWAVIEHDFEPVECKGFRIFTNYHNSTKITEMEVYSKVYTAPSLIDNLILISSHDGEIWNTAFFNAESDQKINAFVGGSPRYFTLDIDSANIFTLNEIEFLVGDQVKMDDCSNMILLDHAKSGEISASTSIVLTNVYGRPLDLTVDLPREKSEIGDVIFWSKLHSQEDVDKPQIGPPAKLYKEEDIEVGNANYQCAINDSAYGLKNLVDGKEAYTQSNSEDWISYGTLISGVSLDYSNDPLYRCTEFTFPATSSEYWKISFPDHTAYTMGFTKSSNWSTQYGISQCTFTYEAANYYAPLTFYIPDKNTGHDMAYRLLGSTLSKTTSFEIRFTIKPTGAYGYVFVEAGMINYRADGNHPMGVYILLRPYNGLFGLRVVDSSGGYDESWGGSYSINTTYYVKLRSDGANHYYAQIWSDKWDGSTLVSSRAVTTSRVWTSNKWGITNGYDGGPTGSYMSGILSDAVFHVKDVFCYNGSTRNLSSQIYYTSIDGITSQSDGASSTGSSLSPMVSIRPDNNAFGIKLTTSDPLNKIRLIHSNSTNVGTIRVYTSPDNLNDYLLVSSGTKTLSNSTFYGYFAIDLENNHDLSIIRNYGTSTNKYSISLATNVEYSNTDTSNISSVVWNTGSYNDARWLRVKWTNGDSTTRTLRKLGIYPDITNAYCLGGGYNCEWESLGTILSDYTPSTNVAYGATVTGTNYYFLFSTPDHAVDGIHTDYDWSSGCWAFQRIDGVNPYIELDFEGVYTINKVVLYHGYNPADGTYMNTSYEISVSPTSSGSFTTIFTKTGNTDFTATHQFTPIAAQRLRLTITGYNTQRSVLVDPVTGTFVEFMGSFLREIEVYTYTDEGYVDSETWPIVAMDLQNGFSITGHSLVNKDTTDTATDWDNNESSFLYSDNIFDDPKKVSFASSGSTITVYQKTADSGNLYKRAVREYLFDNAIYFARGNYSIVWDSKSSSTASNVGIRLEGSSNVDIYNSVLSTSYVSQSGVINIPEDGFYNVKGYLFDEYTTSDLAYWGIRNPRIYRSAGLRKWAAVTRDTATNYGTPAGVDYLSSFKVYGDSEYKPFEYSWWWYSSISTLSNDPMNVVVGSRSLKVSYPTSSGIDVLSLREGDVLNHDSYFDPKHFLHFWWYIDDINNLDTTFGNLKFGDTYNSDPIYYQWNISSMSLSSGWNELNLKFEDADYFYPAVDTSSAVTDLLDPKLDFMRNGRDLKSFVLTYRGVGNPFDMCLDDLRINRNVFDEDVKFGKGLFLNGYEYLDVPISSVSLEKGSVEFWMKAFTNYYGADLFDNLNSRVLFTIVNNNNNIISLGIKSTGWFMPLVGHVRKSLLKFDISLMDLPPSAYLSRGDVVHVGVVWSNDGSFTDNGDTIRLYINNELIASTKQTWDLDDTKAALVKFGGPNTQLAYNYDIWGGGIFENIKIYDYCKTSFNTDYEGISKDIVYSPNEFLEISQDNVNFYGLGSLSLPFVFERVPIGDSEVIYIRTNKTDNFKKSSLTATLIVEWLSSI